MQNVREVFGVPNRQNPPRSEIRVTGANGGGSTNTKVWRWTTILTQKGTAIKLRQSAVLGDQFQAMEDGIYSATLSVPNQSATGYVGICKNGTQLTTNPESMTDNSLVAVAIDAGGNTVASCSWTGNLAIGDVISFVTSNTTAGSLPSLQTATMVKVAN